MKTIKWTFFAFIMSMGFMACQDDDTMDPMDTSATFTVTIENNLPASGYLTSGTTGLIMPGESETVTFHAGEGHYLSLATMFVQSNDLFYGFSDMGYALYDEDGNPQTGDITASVDLWDAGTEVNQEPGVGPDQAPRQSGPNTGPDENGVVQLVSNSGDGFTYPSDEEVIRLTLSHDGSTEFTLLIENRSDNASLSTPLAPGTFVVHGADMPLFTAGEAAANGLEGLAEDGNIDELASHLDTNTQYVSPLAPGVFAIHSSGAMPLFSNGTPDRGEGLEALAEDGDASLLAAALGMDTEVETSGVFNTPVGASEPGPLMPGNAYTFTFEAEEGDYLNFATMLVETNDLFFAFNEEGIELFPGGEALTGEVSDRALLWDAGTEENEYPGAGHYQPIRGGANSGPDENGNVRPVDDGFTYPVPENAIRITIDAE